MHLRRRLALVYGHQGPWISTHGMRQPRLQVSGLRDGHVVLTNDKGIEWTFSRDGIFEVSEGLWMQVCYNGDCSQGPICIIKGEAA